MSDIYDDIAVFLGAREWFMYQTLYKDGLPGDPVDSCCLSVVGGVPERTHNVPGTAWINYGVEIKVRASSSDNARSRSRIAYLALDGIVNIMINGTMYRSIFAISPPVIHERDPGGETVYAVSFNMTRRE